MYLRGHEGRGIGLGHKLRAYTLQDEGRDTVEANLELGFPADSREYGIGAQILVDLGVTTMRLMTNNPAKYGGIEGYGLEIVERVPVQTEPTDENIAYLRAKQDKLGHLLGFDPDDEPDAGAGRRLMGEYAAHEGDARRDRHAVRDRRSRASTATSPSSCSTGAETDAAQARRGRRRRSRGCRARSSCRSSRSGSRTSGTVDAVICLGAVIRGETAHFEYVAGECAAGITRVVARHRRPGRRSAC